MMLTMAMAMASASTLVACGTEQGDRGESELVEADGGFVDDDGREWILLGDANITNLPVLEENREVADAGKNLDDIIVEVTLEEAAAMLRPHMEMDGLEYTVTDAEALEFAATVRDIVSSGDSESNGSGSPSEDVFPFDDPDAEVEERALISGYGTWYKVNSWADNAPYNRIATMDSGAGKCTAFKIGNHYTAATAGHCVASKNGSWKSRQRIQFAAGSGNTSSSGSGDEKEYLPSSCYARSTPGCFTGVGVCDYAVLRLRGGGAWCNYNDYNVGYLGHKSVSSSASSVYTRMASYPGTPPSGGYPSLYYQTRSDSWANGSQLRYRMDTLGGSSGAPTFNSSNQVRSIHSDQATSTYNYGMRMTTTMYNWIIHYGGY